MQQTQFIGGTLWGELTTAVTIPGDPTERAGAAWFAVRPSLTGAGAVTASVEHQGYVVQSGGYVIYPAIQADPSGHAAVGITLTASDQYPSTAYAALAAGQSGFGPVTVLANGTGPYDPAAHRWGDYGWAVLDPVADAVWLANEYVPTKSSQTPDGLRNWGTRVAEISLS
jgi:hypothetical protein